MRLVRCSGYISTACLIVFSAPAGAYAQRSPLLPEQVLSRIEANIEQYTAAVPSFVCDEHITSQEFHDGRLKHQTTLDAVFRVTRSASQKGVLTESREIRSVDGKPSDNKKVKMPLSFSGGFGGALAKFLSADRRPCFDFQPDAGTSSIDIMAFTFAARPTASDNPACGSVQPATTGRFVIDLTALQVTHIERTNPNPVGKDQAVTGTASIEFAPVTFGGESFWLPTTISAFTSETPQTNSVRFTAHYSDCHRFSVTTTILPATPN